MSDPGFHIGPLPRRVDGYWRHASLSEQELARRDRSIEMAGTCSCGWHCVPEKPGHDGARAPQFTTASVLLLTAGHYA